MNTSIYYYPFSSNTFHSEVIILCILPCVYVCTHTYTGDLFVIFFISVGTGDKVMQVGLYQCKMYAKSELCTLCLWGKGMYLVICNIIHTQIKI